MRASAATSGGTAKHHMPTVLKRSDGCSNGEAHDCPRRRRVPAHQRQRSLTAARRNRLGALAFEDLLLTQGIEGLGNRLEPLPRDRFTTSV
jgi:hypothetical protein